MSRVTALKARQADSRKILETCNFAKLSQFMLLFTQSSIKIKAQNIMTESNSPNLVSLLKLENSKVLLDPQWPLLFSPRSASSFHSRTTISLWNFIPHNALQWQAPKAFSFTFNSH